MCVCVMEMMMMMQRVREKNWNIIWRMWNWMNQNGFWMRRREQRRKKMKNKKKTYRRTYLASRTMHDVAVSVCDARWNLNETGFIVCFSFLFFLQTEEHRECKQFWRESFFVCEAYVCVCVLQQHHRRVWFCILHEILIFSLFCSFSLRPKKKQTCLNCEYIFFWHRVFSSSLFLFCCRACHVFDSFTS